MAKKQLEEDMLAGGSINTDKDKAKAKAEKLAAKNKAKKEKLDAKRARIKSEIDKLKEQKEKCENEEEKKTLDAKIKKLSDKYNSVGSAPNGLAPRTKKIIQSAVCIFIVVALLVTYVSTGLVRKGFIASLSIPAQTLTAATITNGTEKAKVKVSTYNFYFASTYNSLISQQSSYEQYGLDLADMGMDVDFDQPLSKQTYTDPETNETMTWSEHMEELVLDSIESTYTYYLEAVAQNDGEEPEITEEQQSEIDEALDSYKETANQYGYTLSGYLVRAMGKGVTEAVFRTEATRQYIAQNYQSELSSSTTSADVTEEEVTAYKDENIDNYKTVDIKIFECSTEDDAKAFADELKADGSNFAELAVKYSSGDFYKRAYAEDTFSTVTGATRNNLISHGYAIATPDDSDAEELTYSGLDWLFSSDRKAGDIKQESTTVVYVLSPAEVTDRKTVNVRHILIAPENADENAQAVDATESQWNAAYSKAESILNEWKSGDATEDSFAALVADNSTDTGSTENGGLYEDVATGEMVDPFSNWCFDSSRKAGDTAIVMTEYGYHIMYFVGANNELIWYHSAEQDLINENSTSATDKLEEAYTLKVNWFGSRYFEKDVDIDS